MKSAVRFVLFAILVIAAFITPTVTRSAPIAPVLVDRAGGAYNGVEVTLVADKAPAAGDVVTLTLTARPLRPAADLTVEWQLPDGGVLLDGPAADSLGPVDAGQSATITRRVRFDGPGVYEVRVRAGYFANEATWLAASGVLFFATDPGAPTAGDFDPRTPVYEPPADRPTVDKSHLAGAGRAADDDPCFNVSGFLSRENKMPVAVVDPENPAPPVLRYKGEYQDQIGSAVPVHHILVEMREEDNVSDDSYGHTITDANGRFTFSFCDDDGVLNDELELYFRVCSEVRDGNNLIARIEETDERELYCWNSNVIDSEGGDVDFDLTVYKLDQTQASVFNIADALYYAWRFWNNNTANSPVFDRSVTVYWQGDSRAQVSFYSDAATAMVIADDSSSRDEWDDSVIMHEWGHFADHQFSCNQGPSGIHRLPGVNNGINGTRMAWSEGSADYYQAAARTIMPGSASVPFYVDPDGPTVNLENMRGVTAGDRDEGAIAALLWDFHDAVNDTSDTVNHGHATIQRVYADADFKNNTQCDVRRFLQVWRKLGLPTDAATAATIVQNVNVTLASLPAIVADAPGAPPPAAGPASPAAVSAAPPFDFRWWDQTTMVVDNSASMAGPAGTPKIATVKTIIGEQVSDLAPAPQGTEFNIYTFNAGSAAVSPLVQGKFFAGQVMPPVNALVANGPDAGCPVPGLGALSQAIVDKFDGDAWLYTDGDSADTITAEAMRSALNERRLRASIVLLGGCGSPARKQADVGGGERTYLTLAADGSQPSGIVPYLLTSLMSGGQFIYVAPDQLANAVDMVRAQLSHSVGAGRWSDYVSTGYTYRWDRLEPWEYQWFPANGLGQEAGQLFPSEPLRVTLPEPFPFYGEETSAVDVDQDGYIVMNPCLLNPQFCQFILTQYVSLLDTDLKWVYINYPPNRAPQSPDSHPYGPQVHVYTANYDFQWTIISTEGLADYGIGDHAYRGYQVWLNYETGEIRFLYNQLRQEAATAEIGLIDAIGITGNNVIVSKNDFSGATSGMGYKFTPAPPQPAKTYEVEVDPLIESVIFMQTGYSGDFAPLTVIQPNGAPVNCNDAANVKCLTVNNKPGDRMVQFVQVNTNGQGGVYTAVVAVGPSGSGTFSFNALAASDLTASSPGSHALAAKSAHRFLIDLGRPTDNGQLQGWLQTPAGLALGAAFTLYDDGGHDDGAAGDGRFGSVPQTPPATGAAYLWVEGVTGGVAFKRSDPAPFNFQPLVVEAAPDYVEGFYASGAYAGFGVTNQDSVAHCYTVQFTAPTGWWVNSPYTASGLCLAAGASAGPYAYVGRDLSGQTLGEVGDVTLTVTEVQEGAIAGSDVAQVALFRPVAALEFDNRQTEPIRPNGSDTVELALTLLDDLGQIVGYSGPFSGELTASNGTVSTPTGMYDNGRLPILFTAGTTPGMATVSALAEGGLTAETTITLAAPVATDITIIAAPIDLSAANQSQLTVTVTDTQGNPAAGETVRLIVSDDDGSQGKIAGSDVFEGVTNAQGRLTATFVKTAGGAGEVVIRAELLDAAGAVRRETSVVLYLSGIAADEHLFLPIVSRPK